MKIYCKKVTISHHEDFSCVELDEVLDSISIPEMINHIEIRLGTEGVHKLLVAVQESLEG